MVARTLTVEQISALRLPTVEEVQTAVAAVPQLELGSWREWDAAPGVFLEVGPGMIRLYRSASHLPDAARDRYLAHRRRRIDSQVAEDRALYRSSMALLTDREVESIRGREPRRIKTTGRITGWSRRSRARMNLELRRLDFRPLFDAGLEPAMITLTMPGQWEQLAPTPAAFKLIVNRFMTAYQHSWGARLAGVWKMEFQRRGAPHLHILMTPPEGIAAGMYPFEFRDWLSHAWARAVGAEGDERLRHERAGTGVDYVGDAYRDPQRIAVYFGKHGFFEAKDYQNEMPRLWLDAIAAGEQGARFWGVWGLKKASAVLQLDDVAAPHNASNVMGDVDVTGIIGGSVVETSSTVEERQHWCTDASILRAAQRDTDHAGSGSSDAVKVQRYMRKLSRARAMRGEQLVRNKHGQLVLPRDSRAIRRIRFEAADPSTGEIRTLRRYRIGYYAGGSGFLLLNDGIQAARDIQRLLDARAAWALTA